MFIKQILKQELHLFKGGNYFKEGLKKGGRLVAHCWIKGHMFIIDDVKNQVYDFVQRNEDVCVCVYERERERVDTE